MRLTIPDDAADHLASRLPAPVTQEKLEHEVERLLAGCAAVVPGQPFLVLHQARIEELARILARPSLTSYTDLLASLDRLAALSFGHIRLEFSPGQLEELEHRAKREGMPVEEYTRRVIRSLTSNFFTTHPARDEWPQVSAGELAEAEAADNETVQIT